MRLKALMKTMGMSQADLAERCGITQAGISQIVNGERTPSIESLCLILTVIPVSFEKLTRVTPKAKGRE
jgi:transcriptional regulator with XRE-family HTH domain